MASADLECSGWLSGFTEGQTNAPKFGSEGLFIWVGRSASHKESNVVLYGSF